MPRLVFVPARGWKREYPTEISAVRGRHDRRPLPDQRALLAGGRALARSADRAYSARRRTASACSATIWSAANGSSPPIRATTAAWRTATRSATGCAKSTRQPDPAARRLVRWRRAVPYRRNSAARPAKPNPQRAFYETRRERSVIDFNEFTSESTANRLALLARAVKKASDNNALVSRLLRLHAGVRTRLQRASGAGPAACQPAY